MTWREINPRLFREYNQTLQLVVRRRKQSDATPHRPNFTPQSSKIKPTPGASDQRPNGHQAEGGKNLWNLVREINLGKVKEIGRMSGAKIPTDPEPTPGNKVEAVIDLTLMSRHKRYPKFPFKEIKLVRIKIPPPFECSETPNENLINERWPEASSKRFIHTKNKQKPEAGVHPPLKSKPQKNGIVHTKNCYQLNWTWVPPIEAQLPHQKMPGLWTATDQRKDLTPRTV